MNFCFLPINYHRSESYNHPKGEIRGKQIWQIVSCIVLLSTINRNTLWFSRKVVAAKCLSHSWTSWDLRARGRQSWARWQVFTFVLRLEWQLPSTYQCSPTTASMQKPPIKSPSQHFSGLGERNIYITCGQTILLLTQNGCLSITEWCFFNIVKLDSLLYVTIMWSNIWPYGQTELAGIPFKRKFKFICLNCGPPWIPFLIALTDPFNSYSYCIHSPPASFISKSVASLLLRYSWMTVALFHPSAEVMVTIMMNNNWTFSQSWDAFGKGWW